MILQKPIISISISLRVNSTCLMEKKCPPNGMWWIIALGCFRKSESFVISEVCANQRLHWAHTTLCSYLRLTKYHIPTAFQKPLELTEAFRQYTRRLMKDRPLNWKNTSIYLFIYLYLLYCAISPLSPLKCEKHRKKSYFSLSFWPHLIAFIWFRSVFPALH